jgi:hypothetical protein
MGEEKCMSTQKTMWTLSPGCFSPNSKTLNQKGRLVYLFMYVLFHDAASNTNYSASKDRMINE